MSYFYSLVLFAVACSVTPGPNNIMVMTSGVNFGFAKSLPVLFGICIGFGVMLLAVGMGFGQIFERFPELHQALQVVGIVYLLYLAWLISGATKISESESASKPITFMKGALFQWVNPKAWIVATGAVSTFTSTNSNYETQIIILVTTFLVVSFPCVGVWLSFGTMLKKYLDNDGHRKWFNLSMAFILVLSVVPVVWQLVLGIA